MFVREGRRREQLSHLVLHNKATGKMDTPLVSVDINEWGAA